MRTRLVKHHEREDWFGSSYAAADTFKSVFGLCFCVVLDGMIGLVVGVVVVRITDGTKEWLWLVKVV